MAKNNYYIPKLSEFKDGFKYQVLIDNKWKEQTFSFWYVNDKDANYDFIDYYDIGLIRAVKKNKKYKNKMEQLKFKKLDYKVKDKEGNETVKPSAGILPTKANSGDAGYDLTATRLTQELDDAGKVILVYHTDIAVEIPEGYVGLLVMRSSICNRSLTLANAAGIIDSGYRGELTGKFKITTDALPRVYQLNESFAQLVVVPYFQADPVLVDELSVSQRGEKGYGSSDLDKTKPKKEDIEEFQVVGA